ncbi:MAG: hypothetical protein V3T82_08090 [Nitrospinaceae bacterium]
MFHWHKWKIVEKEILPSGLEQLSDAGAVEISSDRRLLIKPCIVTYRCECGAEKVKRI